MNTQFKQNKGVNCFISLLWFTEDLPIVLIQSTDLDLFFLFPIISKFQCFKNAGKVSVHFL